MDVLASIVAVLRYRAFFKCPFCQGAGGAMQGYYEPEWCECPECYDQWNTLVDRRLEWFEGRMSFWNYVRSRISMACGLWYRCSIVRAIGCRIGRHRWMDESDMEPGLEICCVCYEHRHVGTEHSPITESDSST